MFDRYGVDGIMIGRAAVGRPWIFRDIRHYLNTGELLSEPTVKEKADLALYHFNLSLEHKEGKKAIFEMRRHFRIISKIAKFQRDRLRLRHARKEDEIKSIIMEISQKWGDYRSEDKTAVYTI